MVEIRAVLFDMGGTLVKPEPTSKILKAHGIIMPIEKISKAVEKAREKMDADKMLEFGAKFWVNFNLIVLKYLGIEDDVLPLAEAIDREWWDYADILLYSEVPEVLHKLRERGLKIGIITNTF